VAGAGREPDLGAPRDPRAGSLHHWIPGWASDRRDHLQRGS